MKLIIASLLLLGALNAPSRSALHELPIERTTVQSGTVFELNVGLPPGDARTCRALLADDGRTFCPMVGRRWELGEIDRNRMLALANWNNDLGDYWEWSAEGLYGTDPTNDAYRLGVNYIVYAMTH